MKIRFLAGPDDQSQEREDEQHDYEDEVDDMLSEVITIEEADE